MASSLFSQLAEKLAPAAHDAPTTVLSWAEQYRQIEGRPFTLDRFLPLKGLYEDTHPRIVIMKPAQRGVSEFAINYASFALDRGAEVWANGLKNGLNVGYVFPTKNALEDFSKERISGLVEETEYLQALLDDGDNFNAVTFKQVGNSFLYLRGGWSVRALKSFPADIIILDEYDEMAAGAPALARRRMNASPVRREIDISTPTVPGFGIHDLYNQSDRRVYEQQHSCGEWVSFDFWRDVRVDGQTYEVAGGRGWRFWSPEIIRASDVTLHCPACKEILTEAERCAEGRWRAEAPSVQGIRGYWVPWWPFPVADLTEYSVTAVSQDPSEITELYRSDLGLPYETKGTRITREQLAALSHALPNGQLPDQQYHSPTLGIDVGSRLHYRLSGIGEDGHRYVLAMGSVQEWSELDVLMSEHGVRLAVVDALPEQRAARDFVDRHKGRAVTATYPTDNALKGVLLSPADPGKAIQDGKVSINRTMAMDGVYAAVATASERWPAVIHNDLEVIEHMTAPTRIEVVDSRGQPRASWVHTKPDHLFHASVYDLVARALLPVGALAALGMGAAKDSRIRSV